MEEGRKEVRERRREQGEGGREGGREGGEVETGRARERKNVAVKKKKKIKEAVKER